MTEKLNQICAGIAETQTMINLAKSAGKPTSILEQILFELITIRAQIIENSKESIIQELRVALS